MNKQLLHMQKLAGLITESEYKQKLGENKTAEELYQMFKDEDLLNDRREYDIEDLVSAYPGLSKEEAEKLYQKLQKINESSFKDKIKELVHASLGETKKKKQAKDVAPQEDSIDDILEPTDADMGMDMSTDTDVDTGIDIDPKVKNIQNLLQKAYANAKSLGDEKLMTQIGNTITMVVRNQVLGGQAVAESLNEALDKLSNDILNDGIGNKDRGTVFFEAWHLATNSGMTDEEAWNIYTKGDVNIRESLEKMLSEDDIFNGSYSISDEAYERMESLVNSSDLNTFLKSAENIMQTLTNEGFEVKDVFYYLYTRLTANV